MKTVKVSIQDENTLVLQEDGQKGDLIDLKSIHEIDIDKSTIDSVVKSIKRDVFNTSVKEKTENIERESKLREQINEQKITDEKNHEIAELTAKLQSAEIEKKLAVTEAVRDVEKERDQLRVELVIKDNEHKTEMKLKDEVVAQYKDMKTKLSTKMIGETLEQHCEIEFNKIRATAFPKAYFEKDNDTKTGSKGDYIYRENDGFGNEIISIMFDMKNEQDETATKKKNDDFLKELDKDRTEKKCEYAVLVSLLEADNELYNTGIVDVSHRYNKMYVIRPQFFIPMITVLRNAALSSLKYRGELALVKSQNIDITNFESELHLFQDGFMKNVKDSSSKFEEAMEGIDATIKKLEGIKDALRLSNKHLLTAGNKVETVSVKRFTKDNPTMSAKFAGLKKDKN